MSKPKPEHVLETLRSYSEGCAVFLIADANNATIRDTVDILLSLQSSGLAKTKAKGGWIAVTPEQL